MSKIKFLLLPVLCLVLACAPKINLIKGEEPLRIYPVFLTTEQHSAAFKAEVVVDGYQNNFLLMLSKKEYGDYQVKIIGDYASVLLNATLKDGNFTYNHLPKNIFNKIALSIFEDTAKILLIKPTDFLGYAKAGTAGLIKFKSGKFVNTYYFKSGLSYPYALKQSKGAINKNIEYNDYKFFGDKPLPEKIIITESKGRAQVVLSLISIK